MFPGEVAGGASAGFVGPDDLVAQFAALRAEDAVAQKFEIVGRGRIGVEVKRACRREHAPDGPDAACQAGEIGEERGFAQRTAQTTDQGGGLGGEMGIGGAGDVLVIGGGGGVPRPAVGERGSAVDGRFGALKIVTP